MDKMPSLEDQFEPLKNHFGALVSTVRDLKVSVDELKKKSVTGQHTEINEVLETQRVIEEVIVSNTDAIHKLKCEIADLKNGDKPVEPCENQKGLNHQDDFMKEIIEKQQAANKTILENADKMLKC